MRNLVLAIAIAVSMAGVAHATPEFSERSGQGCGTCHLEPMGGRLTETGLEYAASGYTWPPVGGFRVIGPIRKPVRFFVGLVHILTAFIWFGTILYVHLMLKPAYAEKGLPKGEVRLGLVSMMIVGITGLLLTFSRIRSLDVLFISPWGIVLLIKAAIYLVMTGSAVFVILFIGPKLRSGAREAAMPADGVFDPLTLGAFDGAGGKAFVAYEGRVYDVTELKLWKGGQHMKHKAGTDLTAFMPKAPHGPEKLASLPVMGEFDASAVPRKTFHQKAFHFIAYMNLALVFCVIITIAYWRWGI